MDAHKDPRKSKPDFHLFEDVSIFDETTGTEHFCHTCGIKHAVPESVDILVAGPSCKNLSNEFTKRAQYASCTFVCVLGNVFTTIWFQILYVYSFDFDMLHFFLYSTKTYQHVRIWYYSMNFNHRISFNYQHSKAMMTEQGHQATPTNWVLLRQQRELHPQSSCMRT